MKMLIMITIVLTLSSCSYDFSNNDDNSNNSSRPTSTEKSEDYIPSSNEDIVDDFSTQDNGENKDLNDNKNSNQVDTESIKNPINQDSKVYNIEKPQIDKTSYSEPEVIDESIPFKTLNPKNDNTKDKNTSGYITKGENGIKRKEVRKVYINGKYSHTELIKDTYILKEPVHEQKWFGTKEIQPEPENKPKPPNEDISKPKDKMVINGEIWHLYKSFDNADACISNINRLQDEHYREWEGGSMCWSEDLYYSLGK